MVNLIRTSPSKYLQLAILLLSNSVLNCFGFCEDVRANGDRFICDSFEDIAALTNKGIVLDLHVRDQKTQFNCSQEGEGFLRDFLNLKSLTFFDGHFHSLDSTCFHQGLTALELIHVSNSSLECVDFKAFNLPKIREINLSRNLLKDVSLEMTKLLYLYLSHNLLDYFEITTENAPRIFELYVDNNRLKSFRLESHSVKTLNSIALNLSKGKTLSFPSYSF